MIVRRHNELRQKVAAGLEAQGNQPAASNMRKLVWNDEIAETAQRFTDQCIFGHDKERGMCDGTRVGQNFARESKYKWIKSPGSDSLSEEEIEKILPSMIDRWYAEVKDFPASSASKFTMA